jgi:uroporphyrinogen-III decarboxylase
MPTTVIKIDFPPERMAANARRVRAAKAMASADRAPVWVGAYDRYYLAQRGISYGEYLSNPETYLYHKIMNQVWAIQNIPDDRCQAPEISIYLDFENTADASAFGAEVIWDRDGFPWTQPVLRSPEDIDRLEIPAHDAGLWGKLLAWYEVMLERLPDYRLLFNGQEARISILPPGPGGEGPFTIAVQLVGSDLYLWLKLYPEACHRLMDKITTGLIRQHCTVRRLYPQLDRASCCVINDGAELISSDTFREFCVPYDNRIYDSLGTGMADGRSKHMCGKIDHLLPILVEEERITSLWGVGHSVDAKVLAATVGGHCWVRGNVNPVLLLNGDQAEIRDAATRVLATFAPYGGLILADGFNIAPGTPVENIAALVQASEAWGPVGPAARVSRRVLRYRGDRITA